MSVLKAPSTLLRGNLNTIFSLWKRTKCFLATLHKRKFKNATVTDQLFCIFVWGKLRQGNHVIIVWLCFSSTLKQKWNLSWFSNSAGLKSVFWKFRYDNGLVFTVGLTVELTRRFQISSAYSGRGFNIMPGAFLFLLPCSTSDVCLIWLREPRMIVHGFYKYGWAESLLILSCKIKKKKTPKMMKWKPTNRKYTQTN